MHRSVGRVIDQTNGKDGDWNIRAPKRLLAFLRPATRNRFGPLERSGLIILGDKLSFVTGARYCLGQTRSFRSELCLTEKNSAHMRIANRVQRHSFAKSAAGPSELSCPNSVSGGVVFDEKAVRRSSRIR